MKQLKNIHVLWVGVALVVALVPVFGDKQNPTTLYNPAGKRDPFKAVILVNNERTPSNIYPTEKYDLDQLSLKGIFRMAGKSRALVEAPDGQTFTLFEGDIVGRERATLSRILRTEIIFTQKTVNYLGSTTLVERVSSLPAEDLPELRNVASEDEEKEKSSSKEKKNKNSSAKDSKNKNMENKMTTTEAMKTIMDRPNKLEQEINELMQGN